MGQHSVSSKLLSVR